MNEIARSLATALSRALDEPDRDREIPFARDVAQVLGLDGLDRALDVCAGAPAQSAGLEARIRELLDASVASGTIEPFLAADRELALRAVEHGAVVEGAPVALEGTLPLADVLADWELADPPPTPATMRARLGAPVAAALRSALDWLGSGVEPPGPLRARLEDSAIEVIVSGVNPLGVVAADAVLAAVGGNLGPAGARRDAEDWIVRVPVAAARATYLMLRQGELDLAVPCHAVLRLRMIARQNAESGAPGHEWPVLAPLAPLDRGSAELPLVLVAHGLKRAYLVADQLVWRFPAAPGADDPDPRAPGYDACVVTEDGERYRVADPARLLAGAPAIPPPRAEHADLEAGTLDDERVEPLAAAASAAIATLDFDDFAPATPPGAGAEPATLDPERVTPLRRRALIAEDSIGARVFLEGRLEHDGFETLAVGSAAELRAALAAGAWDAVFVDVELPDRRGRELLELVRGEAGDAEVVALVRDREEAALARACGIARTLAKPFDPDRLAETLRGLARRDA